MFNRSNPLLGAAALSRRQVLKTANAGFGYLALASLLRETAPKSASATEESNPLRPLAPKQSHFPAKAKRIIFLFMEGGPSHMDSFDTKPKLNELAGKPLPPGYKRVITAMGEQNSPLLASQRKWKQHGESGLWVCTPGKWVCHVTRDEFCHFLEGRCTYVHESGEVIEITPDTAAFFPQDWKGVCTVHETVKKVHMIR